jgi:hypothetical protein
MAPYQILILDSQRAELLANWRRGCEDDDFDPRPVVKLFNPIGGATWLLTELVEDDGGDDCAGDIAFGLCDLGMGFPELGYVSLAELREIRLLGGALGIERDEHFKATKTLSEYAAAARVAGRIEAY